ncbi:hypothetical protein Sste5346_010335 [Sporothrix stenoceras]|uniref:Protein kinase domain-containing protein n=1 Tax=Sporothrix stenoceras TaxID=5173 RepID=A0ABR3YGU2_9PEZI
MANEDNVQPGAKGKKKIENSSRVDENGNTDKTYVIEHGTEERRQMDSMIGTGNSGMVHLLPCGTRIRKSVAIWRKDEFILKQQAQHLRNEIAVYKHLPETDGKLDVYLTLEYLPNNTLHEYLRGFTFKQVLNAKSLKGEKHTDIENRLRRRHDSISLRDRARWVLEATDGIAVLHAHDVIHCDIKPENMGLDAQLGVRIFNLAGSSIPGQPPLCAESQRYYMPRESWEIYNAVTDLFALGSSIYHIVTGVRPYDLVPDDDVEAMFQRGEFPGRSAEGAAASGGSKGDDGGTVVRRYDSKVLARRVSDGQRRYGVAQG